MAKFSLLILPGDGIGPEVMVEVRKIIDWFMSNRGLDFDVTEDLVGGAAYDAHGTPLHDDTMAKALDVDAVLLGAVGGPKYDDLDFSRKPERGLLRLRKEMDLYSNLRPAQCFDALADFSSLKPEVVSGLDIMIVRELTSGIYFGEPRGIITEGSERVGINTQRYTESEIKRVARSAFELARRRDNKVCSMERAHSAFFFKLSSIPSAPPIKKVTLFLELSLQLTKKDARFGEVSVLPFSSRTQIMDFLGIAFSRRVASAEMPLPFLSSTSIRLASPKPN